MGEPFQLSRTCRLDRLEIWVVLPNKGTAAQIQKKGVLNSSYVSRDFLANLRDGTFLVKPKSAHAPG